MRPARRSSEASTGSCSPVTEPVFGVETIHLDLPRVTAGFSRRLHDAGVRVFLEVGPTQGLADVAAAVDQVDDPVREPRVGHRLHEVGHRDRRPLGRLHDECVAHRDPRRDQLGRDHRGEVPRRDRADDADRLVQHQGLAVDAVADVLPVRLEQRGAQGPGVARQSQPPRRVDMRIERGQQADHGGRTRALHAVRGHVVHLAVKAVVDPGGEARLDRPQVDAGDADLGKSELAPPGAQLLEHGLVSLGDTVDVGKGWWAVEGRVLRDTHTSGLLTVREALREHVLPRDFLAARRQYALSGLLVSTQVRLASPV